jgi:hypothetical protein
MSDKIAITCIKPNDFPAKMMHDKCEGVEPLHRMSYIRRIDMPSREEMYAILKQKSLDLQSKPCAWEDYHD